MRTVLITGESTLQKQFAASLHDVCDLVGVVHPRAAPANWRKRAKVLCSAPSSAVARLPLIARWNKREELRKALGDLAPHADRLYESSCARIATHVDDINTSEASSLIEKLQPQLIICFGGPIYRDALMSACPRAINYHTGISPAYNGTSSMYFAFANGHFGLCGATLMRLSRRIDGGDILAHFLPQIEAGDNPGRLFVKCLYGGVRACASYIEHCRSSDSTENAVPQDPPMRYYRGIDWRVSHAWSIYDHLQAGRLAGYQRPEELRQYWALEPSEDVRQVRANLAAWGRDDAPKDIH